MNPSLCLGLGGALGLVLGFPNPVMHLPAAALLYPAALALLGLRAQNASAALRAGWLAGLSGSSAALYWLTVPVREVGGLPWALAVPCALAVGAYVGLFGGFFSLCARLLRHHSVLSRCVALALCWFFLEELRGFLFTGFPWLTLSSAFVPWTPVIQAAAYVGSYGLSGLLAGAACLFAEAARAETWRRALCCACGLFIAAGLYGGGLMRLRSIPPGGYASSAGEVRVAMVQGNIDQNQKWEPAYQKATVELYLRMSEEAAQTRPDLLIWPETAMPFYFQGRSLFSERIRAFARGHELPLLLGAPGYEGAPAARRVFNRAFLLNAEGGDAGFYDKRHLVPFGEYLPSWLDLPALEFLFQGVGAFAAGTSAEPLRLGRLALGMLICYETIFPEEAQDRVSAGATLLLNMSNDAWFGVTSAPEQHLQLSVLRAVEQGRTLVRATNTGFSALIDPAGRISAKSGLMRAELPAGIVRLQEELTPFHRLFPYLNYAAFGLLVIAALIRPKKH